MTSNATSRQMPEILRELNRVGYEYADGAGIDFEGFDEFLPESETQEWFKAWTGNADADGSPYLIFGQDGTGGYAAFWLTRRSASLLDQPIVFFGSEGELGVVARNFSEYLWLLAGGYGPYEAICYLIEERAVDRNLVDFAAQHSQASKLSVAEALLAARAEYPDFTQEIRRRCGLNN